MPRAGIWSGDMPLKRSSAPVRPMSPSGRSSPAERLRWGAREYCRFFGQAKVRRLDGLEVRRTGSTPGRSDRGCQYSLSSRTQVELRSGSVMT